MSKLASNSPAMTKRHGLWRRLPLALRFFLLITAINPLILATWTALDLVRSHSYTTRARMINVGDSKERVVAVLGAATHVFSPTPANDRRGFYLGVEVETWAYGRCSDWPNCFYSEFPYFFPFKFRLFGPDPDDVEIEFDGTGKVERVSIGVD